MRYDAVFLDVDGTLLWVDLDVEGYVEQLSSYATNGAVTVDRASGPVWAGLRRHIKENVAYRTPDDLAGFKRRNVQMTASELGITAPDEVLERVAERTISFNPYPESEAVLRELSETGVGMYVLSNWDVELVEVLDGLDWMRYFDGIVVSAVSGVEKPDRKLFEEALELAEVDRERAIHVGNDLDTDLEGAQGAGMDVVIVDRWGNLEARGATFVVSDLRLLPDLLRD